VIWAGGVGRADLATGKIADADTMFRIASITKCFVGLAVMKLKEQGKISLDARVSDIAPEIPIVNPWEKTNPVTVAELLEHTGGLHDYSGRRQLRF